MNKINTIASTDASISENEIEEIEAVEMIILNENSTPQEKFIHHLQNLQSNFGAPTKKKGDPKPNGKGSAGFTTKDKEVLGVAQSDIISWVPAPFDFETTEALKLIAKKVGMPREKLLANVCVQFVQDHMDDIDLIASTELVSEEKMNEMQRQMDAMAAKMARYSSVMERAKALGNK